MIGRNAAHRADPREEYLATDHLLTNLRGRTISSAMVAMAAQGIKLVLTLGSTMILARLLAPSDFGLVTMALTVAGFLRIFKEAGLASATVQRPSLTQAQVSNLFWINLALSTLLGVVVLLSAPAVAWLFDAPQLTLVMAALSLTFPLEGAFVQHMAVLRRHMRFARIALIEVVSLLIGSIVGIVMAVWQYGPWSLIGGQLAISVVALVLTWSMSPWYPRWPVRRSGMGPLLHFGANVTAGSLIFAVGRGADNILIGRYYGSHALGLYSRAEALLSRPLDQLLSPLGTVVVPALARIQDDPERYRRTFLRIYEALALASFIFCGLFLALAEPVVLVLLGRDWQAAAVIFAGLTITAVFRPLSLTCGWLFESGGRGRDSFIASSVLSGLALGAFVIGLPFGPAGVAFAYSLSGLVVQLPFLFYWTGRSGQVRAVDLWAGFFRQLPIWGIVWGATMVARWLSEDYGAVAQLVVGAPLGLLAGGGFILVYRPSYRTAASLFRTLRDFRRGAPHHVS